MVSRKFIILLALTLLSGCAHSGITLNESVPIENGVIARFILFERVTPSGPSARAVYCFTTQGDHTQLADVRSYGSNGPIDSLMGKVTPAAAIAGGVGGIAIGARTIASSITKNVAIPAGTSY